MSGSSSYRIFDIKLKAKENVSPSLMRCVFEGAEVNRMKLEAPDQRIKLLFPAEDGQIPQLEKSDDWYRSYMALPKAQRPVMRTYTLRALRTEQNEMDVEFVLHGETGFSIRLGNTCQSGRCHSGRGAECRASIRQWGV